MDQSRTAKIRHTLALLSLTALALLIHGYHPYAEDAEIYLPGVQKILNPTLFPVNDYFFAEHAGHTLYPNVIATSVRLTRLPLPWVAFLWQIASIFLLLAATRRLATALFEAETARWGAAALMAGLLTLPIAGTDLYILDQYLNPRNLAAFAALFAVAEMLHRRHVIALLWLAFAAIVHPFMSSFAIAFCIWITILDRLRPRALGIAAVLPFGLTFEPPPPEYHAVALRHDAHYLVRWTWYEWLGLIGPILLFWWFARWSERRGMKNLELLSRAMIPFVSLAAAAALVLSIPARFEALARLQPLRCLALCYMVLVVVGGGLLGQYLLRDRVWRWIALFVPLSLGVFIAQRELFPASSHIEWPWAAPRNPWAQAFDWIRDNTPPDAFFALDPEHMHIEGEDENGFRARAQRSRLADDVKDQGAASMFPPMSVRWMQQFQDQRNWKQFSRDDFERLRQKYGIGWIVLQQPGVDELNCPYQNSAVLVCKLN